MLVTPKPKCPFCGTIVSYDKPVGKPHECTGCRALLQRSRSDSARQFWASVVVSVGICWFGFGLRGWRLAAWTVVVLLAVDFLLIVIGERIRPTPMEPYDGHKIIG